MGCLVISLSTDVVFDFMKKTEDHECPIIPDVMSESITGTFNPLIVDVKDPTILGGFKG